MIGRKLRLTANLTRRSSRFLSNELRNSYRLERRLQANSLRIKKKLLEERNRTLKALYRSSTEERKGRRGLSTFGGILGTGILAKGLRRRSPSALLRGQKTPILSRGAKLSRFGRLGRIGPLAVLGTGLDFAGRKAEGQTNLQAGLGAGGGLAGALAFGKAGATIGTVLGGPVGTVVGGIGGSIIGGLAGGKLADLFTGADRRRQFEIQKNIISNQKTLFSDANDDLERVLDKFAIRVPRLDFVKRDDDDRPDRFLRIVIPTPIPKKPVNQIKEFFKKPIVQDVSKIAVAATALILSRGKLRGSEKVIVDLLRKKPATFTKLPLEKQLQVIVKDIKKQNLITTMTKGFEKNRKEIILGKRDAMKRRRQIFIKKKRIQDKLDKNLAKELFELNEGDKTFKVFDFLRKNNLESPTKLKGDLNKVFRSKREKLLREFETNKIDQKTFDKRSMKMQKEYLENALRLDRYSDEIMQLFDSFKHIKPESTQAPKLIEGFFRDLRKIPKKFNIKKNTNVSSVNIEPTDTDIALNQQNENNIFIGGGNQIQQSPQSQEGGTSEVKTVNISNTYDNATKYAEMTALMTV
tara:strand:- start:1291 stop:3030 length:1740 start_codon:yes stop_codon:yes gene_type:complete